MSPRRSFGHLYRRGTTWWLRYSVGGQRVRESARTADREKAEKLLARREAELGAGVLIPPTMRRTTFADLERMVRDAYVVEGRRSTERLDVSLAHLRHAFGRVRAEHLTLDRLNEYVATRTRAGVKSGTIRNELNALHRALTLAVRAGRLARLPAFPTLAPADVRQGFFDADDLAAVVAELPPPLRGVAQFGYCTGWRKSEILGLRWRDVDFTAGTVRLEPGTTKNGEGRTFPFAVLPALRELLHRQRAETDAVERRLGILVPWVFHRDGRPIRDFFAAWKAACHRAATVRHGALEVVARPQLVGRLFHDLRRSAVRNLERAGVSRSVAMKLTGHRTAAVYSRYAITSEADLAEGVAKLARLAANGGPV